MQKGLNRAMREFVGETHRGHLERLHAAWLNLRRPRMITLSGFPGSGKSRLVQELYRRLASAQTDPPYWPREIPVSGDELTARRKRLAPGSFTVPGRSEPDFVWLAIEGRIEQDTGLPAFALGSTAFAQQIHDHVVGVLAAAERSSGATRQVARDLGQALVQLGAFIPLLAPLATAVGMSDSFGALRRAVQSIAAVRSRDTPDREVGHVDSQGVLSEAVGAFSRLSEYLPVVLVVEDAHDLDEMSVRFIHELLEAGRGRVLVVATAWTDRLGVTAPPESFGRLASHSSWVAIEQWAVPLMESRDLTGFVLAEAPGTSPAVVDALVARSGGNPLLMEGLLRLRVVARSLNARTRAFEVDTVDLEAAGLPRSIAGLYERLWEELPEAVQDVLMVASIEGAVFTADWSVELAEAWLGSLGAAASHAEARDIYAWVRSLDDRVDQFVELSLMNAAVGGAGMSLTDRERLGVRNAIVQRAIDERRGAGWFARPEESRISLLRQVINACDEGLLDNVDEFACRYELAKFEADRYGWRNAIAVLDNHIPPGGTPEYFEPRGALAEWFGAVGRDTEAADLFEALLEDQRQALGSNHEDTLKTRHSLALLLKKVGASEQVPETFEVLLADSVRSLGSKHPLSLSVRNSFALSLADHGRPGEAFAQLEGLLADRSRMSDLGGPDELTIRHNLASCLSDLGQKGEALVQFRELLEEQTRLKGDGHPSCFRTRGYIAGLLLELGELEKSLDYFNTLLSDQVRVYGEGDPDTLDVRTRIAEVLWKRGSRDEAELALQMALADMTRELGENHQRTLAARGLLMRWCGEVGRIDEALELCETLLEDQVRVLGSDSRLALVTRGWLARWSGELGRVGEAIDLFGALLDDQRRVLGVNHEWTFDSRAEMARWLGEAGRLDEAVGMCEELLADQIRIWGAMSRQALETRGRLARWTGEGGRTNEAIERCSDLLNDLVRELGEKDALTLETRGLLVRLLGEAGHAEEALELGEGLLADQLQVLSPENRAVMKTRSDVALLHFELGRADESLEQFRALLNDEEHVFGLNDTDTRVTRRNLAHVLRAVGRVEEALEAFQTLMRDEERELGSTHPETMESRGNVAYLLSELGHPEAATPLLESLLADQVRELGSEHQSTTDTRRWLDALRRGTTPY